MRPRNSEVSVIKNPRWLLRTGRLVLLLAALPFPGSVFGGAGVQAWVQRYSNPEANSDDYAVALAMDAEDNIIVAGSTDAHLHGADMLAIKYSSIGVALWTNHYNGPGNGQDDARAVAVDLGGNVYVSGRSYGSEGSFNYATIAYSSAGTAQWTNLYNGADNGDDSPTALAVDTNGTDNVYVTGSSSGTGGYSDYVTIAYSSSGVALWTNRYNGPGNLGDAAQAVAVGRDGNVYVTGGSAGSGSGNDYATIAYSSAGLALWTNRYNGPGNSTDTSRAMAVDSSGNVCVTGSSYGTGTGNDYATVVYSSEGLALWTNRYHANDDNAQAIAVDRDGSVYVTGSSGGSYPDYATIAYTSAGVPLWTNRYNGPRNYEDTAQAVAVGTSGNVYVTGYSFQAYATIAYSATGVPLWTNRYDGDGARAIGVDRSGRVYVTGSSSALTSRKACLTLAYSAAGAPLWTNRYNGLGNNWDKPQAIAVDDSGNVYITGYSTGASGRQDYTTMAYSNAGVPVWTRHYNGPGNYADYAQAVALDRNSNVFVTGYASVTGPASDYTCATLAYSSSGLPLWTNSFRRSTGLQSGGRAMAVDANGNVLVTGYSVSSNGYSDYATIAYSGAGAPLWTNFYNGLANAGDEARAAAVDSSGNVYVTGASDVVGSSSDYATVAYSSDGVPLWTNRYGTPGTVADSGLAIAADHHGRIYVTGRSIRSGGLYESVATIAYSSGGIPLWTNYYGGLSVYGAAATALAVDDNGHVYVAGYSASSYSDYDFFVVAYSGAGEALWTNRYNGPGNDDDQANAVAVDGGGNVYVTGYCYVSGSSDDYATIAYSTAGVPLWTNLYNGPANGEDETAALAVDRDGAVLVTGASDGDFVGTTYDFATVKYISSPGIGRDPESRTNLAGTTASFSVSAGGTRPLSYQWLRNGLPLSDGDAVSGSTTTNLVLANVGLEDAGEYSVVVSNGAGTVTSAAATLTVLFPLSVTAIALLPDNNYRLALSAASSSVYELQASTNLIDWIHLARYTNPPDSSVFYFDLQATNFTRRFYRALWTP